MTNVIPFRSKAATAQQTKPAEKSRRKRSRDLIERDLEVLDDLSYACGMFGDGWCRPLDVGGSDGSDHSYRLNKLFHLGCVEHRQRGTLGSGRRGSKVYRISELGRSTLAQHKAGTSTKVPSPAQPTA